MPSFIGLPDFSSLAGLRDIFTFEFPVGKDSPCTSDKGATASLEEELAELTLRAFTSRPCPPIVHEDPPVVGYKTRAASHHNTHATPRNTPATLRISPHRYADYPPAIAKWLEEPFEEGPYCGVFRTQEQLCAIPGTVVGPMSTAGATGSTNSS